MVILVAAHETGSANALVPVIRDLSSFPKIRVQILATGDAPRIFREEGIPYRQIELPEKRDAGFLRTADRLLEDFAPDLLILGTAWEKNLEKAFLELAPARGIRSLSIVDNWSHFRERFLKATGPGSAFPDRVAVVDEHAQEQALKEGIPPERLVITGQPHLESVVEKVKSPVVVRQAAALRQRWLAAFSPEKIRLVLFVSEPFSIYSASSTPYHRGYTEVEALEGLLEAAGDVERNRALRVQVVVKLHPRESQSCSPMAVAAASKGITTEKEAPGLASLIASDAVVGMASMLLFEAALAGRPTVSFEPNGKEEVAFHGSRIGAVAKASSVQELQGWLDAALTRPAHVSSPALARLARGRAARKIVETALELANAGQEVVG